jgi:putative OPT family oligopeptide transporter
MSDAPRSPNKVVPYIPATTSLPELTVGVLILGSILSIVLAGANAYLGMFAGMTVSASVPAAVISMGLFRIARRGNILQNNGVQTAAASGEGLAAGAIFTLPALILLGTWAEFSYVETTLIALFGGVLGVLFTIPLRRALIIDQPLQFPEGVATAEVLKIGAQGGGGVGVLAATALIAGVAKLGVTGLKLWGEVIHFGAWIVKPTAAGAAGAAGAGATGTAGAGAAGAGSAGTPFYFGINASPALLAVGYIVGFNVALVIFSGAVLNRWIAVPLYALLGDPSARILDPETGATLAQALDGLSARDAADTLHGVITRYLGVGGMLVGGVWSLFKLRKSLLGGVRAGLDAYKHRKSGSGSVVRTEHDMPMNIILILIAISVIPLFFTFHHFTGRLHISAVMAIVVIIGGFLFSAVASYMAGLVGSSNNPVSGITISTILVSAGLLLLMGVDKQAGPVAAILIGGVVCCAAAIGGDNLQDLKCGQLVGSTPWKQQTMQIVGVLAAAIVMAPILNLLHDAYGIGKGLQAPQANLMATVAKGVFQGGLPWTIIGIGAAIAAVIILIDFALESRGSSFRIPVMAFAVGVYLPFDLNVPIFFGGLIALFVARKLDRDKAAPERRNEVERMGLLAAAGLITGEALLGIGLAVPVAIKENTNALALFIDANGQPAYAEQWIPSLVIVGISLILLYKLALRPPTPSKRAVPKT